jgi:hypothetical protein
MKSHAIDQLDRTNTRATDPSDPTRIIQTGTTRTDGFESGIVEASPRHGA